MSFDACQHKITRIVISAGKIMRELKGLPEEKDITAVYNETAPLLGIPVFHITSLMADKIPQPIPVFIPPSKNCPNCGKEGSYVLSSICPNCKDSEGGKYRSGWKCNEKTGGCGYIGDKTEKFFTQRMKEEFPDIAIPNGSKLSLGIETIVDKEE